MILTVVNQVSPWARRRLTVLLEYYAAAVAGEARRYAGRQLREFLRVNPELVDLVPGTVWSEIYRVRAAGTVAP